MLAFILEIRYHNTDWISSIPGYWF